MRTISVTYGVTRAHIYIYIFNCNSDEASFHSNLLDVFVSEVTVKAGFVFFRDPT